MSAPVDLSALATYDPERDAPGVMEHRDRYNDGDYVKIEDVRALLAAAPAPATPAASVDTADFRKLLGEYFLCDEDTEAIGNEARIIAAADAHTASAVAVQQAEIDCLRFELHEATNSLVARMSAPQQHAQAALSDTARNVIAAFNDPHTSLAGVARWINELAEVLTASQQPAAAPSAPEVENYTIPGDGPFGGLIIEIDHSLPADAIEMRGANSVRMNVRTGEITELPAAAPADAAHGEVLNRVAEAIFKAMKPCNMTDRDWVNGAILGFENGFRDQVNKAARAAIHALAAPLPVQREVKS